MTSEHGGREPDFDLRAIKYHRTALDRQLGEAVRIRRRGGEGAVLNSKSEYSRCRIPRLIVEEQDLEEANKKEQEQEIEMIRKLDKNQRTWEQQKLLEKSTKAKKELTQEEREQNKKRMWLEGIGEQKIGKKIKKRKI